MKHNFTQHGSAVSISVLVLKNFIVQLASQYNNNNV